MIGVVLYRYVALFPILPDGGSQHPPWFVSTFRRYLSETVTWCHPGKFVPRKRKKLPCMMLPMSAGV
jgi:hypothetical protein